MLLSNIYRDFCICKHKYRGDVLHFLKEAWWLLLDSFCLNHVNQWNRSWNKGAIIDWSKFSIQTRMYFLLKYSWSWYRPATCETLLSCKDLWRETSIRAEEIPNEFNISATQLSAAQILCLTQTFCRSGQSLAWILIKITFKRLLVLISIEKWQLSPANIELNFLFHRHWMR